MKERSHIIAFLVAAVPLAWLVRRFNFLCDDAFISYRYARSLARGDGLRFNLGVEPPVEGYTNLLWVLWCAVFERVGLDVGVLSRVTSVALAFLVLYLIVRLLRVRAGGGWLAPLCGGLFVGLHPAFGTWATSGMETMAFTAFCFIGFERLMVDADRPRTLQGALALCAAALLRADGAVLCGAAVMGAWSWGRACREPAVQRAAVKAMVAVVVCVGVHLVFRRLYHGDFVPNTAHAKVSLDSAVAWRRGGIYVAHFLVLFPAAAAAPLLMLSRPGGARRFGLAALVPFAAVYLWYWAVGGDYMAFGRFLVPAIPFAALVFATGVEAERESGWRPGKLRLAIVALLLATQPLPAFSASAAPEAWLSSLNFRLHKDYKNQVEAWEGLVKGVERGSAKGRELARVARPGDSLVAGNVGAQAYYSDVFIFDRHGLVTREVAMRDVEQGERAAGHAKGVSALYFLDDRPTVLGLEIGRRSRGEFFAVPPEARTDYVMRLLPIDEERVLQLLVRKDSHLAALGQPESGG